MLNSKTSTKISFCFITQFNKSTGSTRLRIIKLNDFLTKKGFVSHINENFDNADIIIFQKGDKKFIKNKFVKARKQNKFIIFDIDDYMDNLDLFIKNSDLVTVGSNFLKKVYAHLNKNIFVFNGPLDIDDICISLKKSYNFATPKIGWFGNITNIPILNKLKINNVKTITNGGDIEWNLNTIDKSIQQFDLIVIPQDKSYYGASKSNCRMLKTIYLGVPALVSNLDAYVELADYLNYPKSFIINENENWQERIDKIKRNEIIFNFDFNKARDLILMKFSIEAQGKIWFKIVVQKYDSTKHFDFFKKRIYLMSDLFLLRLSKIFKLKKFKI